MIAERNIHDSNMAVVHAVSIQWPNVQDFMVINCLLCSLEKKLVTPCSMEKITSWCGRHQCGQPEPFLRQNPNGFIGSWVACCCFNCNRAVWMLGSFRGSFLILAWRHVTDQNVMIVFSSLLHPCILFSPFLSVFVGFSLGDGVVGCWVNNQPSHGMYYWWQSRDDYLNGSWAWNLRLILYL